MQEIPSSEKVTVESLLKKLSEILVASEAETILKLKSTVEATPTEGIMFASFELFDTQNYGMNYNTFYILERKGKKELHTNYAPFESYDTSFIPQLQKYIENELGSIELSEAEGMEFTEKHEELLFEWFAKCWKLAGGESSKLPTYFAFDKENTFRDLGSGEIIGTDLEVAKKLGHADVIEDQGDFAEIS